MMKLCLRQSVAACCVVFFNCALFWSSCSQLALASSEVGLSVEVIPSAVTSETTCDEWASWLPPRTDPAVVMQVVGKDYVHVERNFIRLMELNSGFTRQNLYLMCLDDASVSVFAALGIRCVPLGALEVHVLTDLWKTRVRALSCLVAEGYDVIMTDSDALWLGDPMEYMDAPGVSGSSIVASRGRFPSELYTSWGATICMGFIFFRATGAGMDVFQAAMERIVLETGDDQVAVNQAAHELGIAWDRSSDMGYVRSVGFGKGAIAGLSCDDGEPFEVTLLPHSKFTRTCTRTPVSNETIVAHCITGKTPAAKARWMKNLNLWSTDSSSSSPP